MSLILSGTDGLSDIDGSAATPAIRGTDANTGIFFPAADTIAFAEGGAEIARFDSSGRLGIGITSPSTPLHIQADSSGNSTRVQGRSSDGYADMSLYNNANTVNNAFFSSSNTATFLGTGTTIPLTFQTNNAERMRINAGAPILCLSGGSTTATGTGIAFPATQSASSDANTLDDYEEGTFTPNQGAGLTVVGTFSSSGSYTKVGRLVTVIGLVTGSTSVASSAGGAICSNLPFTSAAGAVGGVANSNGGGGSCLTSTTSVLSYPAHAGSPGIYFTATYAV